MSLLRFAPPAPCPLAASPPLPLPSQPLPVAAALRPPCPLPPRGQPSFAAAVAAPARRCCASPLLPPAPSRPALLCRCRRSPCPSLLRFAPPAPCPLAASPPLPLPSQPLPLPPHLPPHRRSIVCVRLPTPPAELYLSPSTPHLGDCWCGACLTAAAARSPLFIPATPLGARCICKAAPAWYRCQRRPAPSVLALLETFQPARFLEHRFQG